MKKRNYIFASHGTLAEGLYEAVDIITGDTENVRFYGAYMNQEETKIDEEIELILEEYPKGEEIIVLTDLFGGSVNTAFAKQIEKYGIHLVAGMNLPLALAILDSEEKDTEKMLCEVIGKAKDKMKYCNHVMCEAEQEEEF